MICRRIEVKDFRNIETADVSFEPGVNVVVGDNAQGKTNLIEAIYMTALGKSFRPVKEAETVRFDQPMAHIVNHFSDSLREQTVSMKLFAGKTRRIIEQNGNRVSRMSDMVGAFRVVLFCPEHLSLVQGAPELRRNFLNVALSQLRPVYLRSLQRYGQILKERNSLLKKAPDDMKTFHATIDFWSSQLAHEAAILSAHRDRYVKQADEYVKRCFATMSGEREIPELSYLSSSGRDSFDDVAEVESCYMDLLSRHHDREIGAGCTLWGVHKDDIRIHLNGRPARLYASQGQQRSITLAMKLSEGEISAYESGGDRPVFLFDDVLSELDAHRRAYLMGELTGRQVIMTTCDHITEQDGFHMIKVKDGTYEV